MKRLVARPVRWALRRAGYEVVRPLPPRSPYPPDCDEWMAALFETIRPFTLTSIERVMALVASVEHLVRADIPGALVECGVWRGGSAMAMAATLLRLEAADRDLYLFDTYTHMPDPGPEDVDLYGVAAADMMEAATQAEAFRYLPFDEVRAAVASTGYPMERVHFVQGMVEDTLPVQAPEQVALCRLDTDWYASTRHELTHLWPRLAPGGVLIVDDYGHFMGSKQAVDEHFAALGMPVLLHRIDFTGRLVVKQR